MIRVSYRDIYVALTLVQLKSDINVALQTSTAYCVIRSTQYDFYCATRTNAGRITRSPSMYPFCTTSIT